MLSMDIKEKLNKLNVQRDSYIALLDSRKKRKEELKKELDVVLKSQVLLQTVASEVQSQLSVKIDNIVNLGLSTCFPQYTFELRYVPSRGKTEVRFVIKDGDSEIDVLNQNGGGVVDVLTFCLRVAIYSISSVDNVLLFDEPFRFVSKSLRSKISDLLNVLSEKLNLQFIFVTHIEELSESANRIVVKKINGESKIEMEK